MGAGEQVG
ncbi:hypothetical protein E2C01_095257 [Portunus trituberculatus]|uniref:Uncharacterized protein n=1 Tax=Portunus trituberculatus TaxID=210409 RepID=A0A5B7K386_PORTR|nr:hypothetical protein [Portunus trituberculatus]